MPKENILLKYIGPILTILGFATTFIGGYAVLQYKVSDLQQRVGNEQTVGVTKEELKIYIDSMKESYSKDVSYLKEIINQNVNKQEEINRTLFRLVGSKQVSMLDRVK